MRLEPRLKLFPFIYAQIIQDERDAMNGDWNLPVLLGKQSDELLLPIPQFRSSVDVTSPRIKGSEQVECCCSFVFVFQAHRQTWASGQR